MTCGLDHSIHRPGAEAGADLGGDRLGRLGEPAGIARLDLAAQRGAVAEADGGVPA
jgi:hypothetical protein